MERRDVYLLVSRVVCLALACSSFFIRPVPTPGSPMLRAFLIMKGSVFLEIFMSLFFLASHVGSLQNWLEMAPEDYYMYPFVLGESVLAAFQWGSAGAAYGVMLDDRYSKTCGGPHQAICQSLMIACVLALLTGCLGAANAIVLLVARFRSGPSFLAMVMAML